MGEEEKERYTIHLGRCTLTRTRGKSYIVADIYFAKRACALILCTLESNVGDRTFSTKFGEQSLQSRFKMRSIHDCEIHIHSWTVRGRDLADKFKEFGFSEPRDKSKTPSHFSS